MGIDDLLAGVQDGLSRLDPVAAHAALREPGTYLVDTRPEYQRREGGEVPGAIVIERNHLEWRLDPTSAAHIAEATSADIRWIVICEGGYSSILAAHSLRQIGLVHATDVIGGFLAWQAAGLPIVHPAVPTRGRMPSLS